MFSKYPEGPVKVENYKITPPPKSTMKLYMENLIHHSNYSSEGIYIPKGLVL